MSNKTLKIIDKITDELGLPITDAEKIVSAFSDVAKTIAKLDEDLIEFNKHTEITKEVCKQAREFRLMFVKNRTLGDEIHKELKSDLLLKTRAIDGVRNVYKLKSVEREKKLKDIEEYFQKIEQAKLDEIYENRIEKISKYIEDVAIYNLREMSQQGFDELLKNSKLAYEQKIEEEKKVEEDRIKQEKKDKLHQERKDQILDYWQFLDNKEMRFDELDSEMFIKIKQRLEDKKIAFDKEQEELKKEKIRLEKLADQEAKEKAKLQADLEAKKKADEKRLKEEKEKKDKEDAKIKAKKEADAKAKKEAELAPDKDKLIIFSKLLESVPLPNIKSDEAKNKLNEALKLINQAQLLLKSL